MRGDRSACVPPRTETVAPSRPADRDPDEADRISRRVVGRRRDQDHTVALLEQDACLAVHDPGVVATVSAGHDQDLHVTLRSTDPLLHDTAVNLAIRRPGTPGDHAARR